MIPINGQLSFQKQSEKGPINRPVTMGLRLFAWELSVHLPAWGHVDERHFHPASAIGQVAQQRRF